MDFLYVYHTAKITKEQIICKQKVNANIKTKRNETQKQHHSF